MMMMMLMMIKEDSFGKERKDRARQKDWRRVSQRTEIACGRWRGKKGVYAAGNKGLEPTTVGDKNHQGDGVVGVGPAKP